MSRYGNHTMVDYNSRCGNCGAAREAIEDNVAPPCVSKLTRCKECSLVRQCFDGTCDECRENMKNSTFSNHLRPGSDLCEASFEKTVYDIINDAFKRMT